MEEIIIFKHKKKLVVLAVSSVLILNGCSLSLNNGTDNEMDDEIISNNIISPEVKINEKYYRGVLPYERSPISGTLSDIPAKLDANHFELGLFEFAKKIYNPSSYVFQEGQLLEMDDINEFIFPEENSEFEDFVYTIIEQDYLSEDGQFSGMVIGIVVSQKYYKKDENGEYQRDIYGSKIKSTYSEDELKGKSNLLIDKLLNKIRYKNSDIPVYFSVMKAETDDIKVPGTFFLSAKANKGEQDISQIQDINQSYLFLPTALVNSSENYDNISRGFDYFKEEIDEYIPNFAGTVGLARFIDEQLVELTINLYTEFDSTAEVIQLTQFAITRIPEYFTDGVYINLYISSIDDPKAIYIRNSSGEDFMHIYR